VIVLEKEHFPRFHIGESLLPYNLKIFEQMGLMPTLEAAGLIKNMERNFIWGMGASLCFSTSKMAGSHADDGFSG